VLLDFQRNIVCRKIGWGLWLFLLCDVCVGVHNQPELFPEWLAAFAQVGMWLFYLPGQVLLVLSGRKKEDIS